MYFHCQLRLKMNIIWVCLKMLCSPKPNGFADHYPYEKWLFHWEYTLFSGKPIYQSFEIQSLVDIPAIFSIFCGEVAIFSPFLMVTVSHK